MDRDKMNLAPRTALIRFIALGLIMVLTIVGGVYFWIRQMTDHARKASFLLHAEPIAQENHIFPPPDSTRYEMGLILNMAESSLSGHSIITTKNTSGIDLESIFVTTYPNAMSSKEYTPAPGASYPDGFSAGWMQVTSVSVNGEKARFVDKGINGEIMFPETVDTGDEMNIDMVWKVKIPQAAYRFGNQGGAFMLGDFYPILTVHSDAGWENAYNSKFGDPYFAQCADYSVRFTLPDGYQVVSTGIITNRSAQDDGMQTLTMEAGDVRDFALAAVYDYQAKYMNVAATNIFCLTPAGDSQVNSAVLKTAAEAFRYYSKNFGPYPYPELKVVAIPMKGYQGMEHAGILFLSEDIFRKNYSAERRDSIVAHEVAHQWWYGIVGSNQVEEPWLDEGLANYSAYLYLTDAEKPVNEPKRADNRKIDLTLRQLNNKQQYLNTAYQGGEAFWYALSDELGSRTVLAITRSYLEQYRYKTATGEGLRRLISSEAGSDLNTFYRQWFKENQP